LSLGRHCRARQNASSAIAPTLPIVLVLENIDKEVFAALADDSLAVWASV
jgi:hypothetical protein